MRGRAASESRCLHRFLPSFDSWKSRVSLRPPGLDPVRNFMGYAGYRCVDHFTDDQQLAMLYSAMAYRPTIWALSQ